MSAHHSPSIPERATSSAQALDVIEAHLRTFVLTTLTRPSERTARRGRPEVLPAMALWGALVIGVLRRDLSQVDLWRRLTDRHWWFEGQLQVAKETVYKRLSVTGPSPVQELFIGMTEHLVAERTAVPGLEAIAPWATEVLALDETTLDKVARKRPDLWEIPPGSPELLPGKLTAVLDVRRQLFRSITIQEKATQNERVAALEAITPFPAGSLFVLDLGYFSFPLFDAIAAEGKFFVSRLRAKTSSTPITVLAEQGTTRDSLVYLGAHRADRAATPMRLIEFMVGSTRHTYVTNQLDPARLSVPEVAELYAERWGIEIAFNLVKTDLKLSLIWSSKRAIIAHQIWGVLLIAQLVLAARAAVAERARVPITWVSLNLLVRYLPDYAKHTADPIGEFAEQGVFMGFIREPRRVKRRVPTLPPESYHIPRDLPPRRPARYAGKQ